MDEVTIETLRVPRTARYGIRGDSTAPVTEIWFLLHGYGHSAEVFLDAMAPVAAPGRLLVAPEGLSRFYLKGSHGEVGASWMTKVAREGEIADQLSWLDALHDRILEAHRRERITVHLLGYSQGAAAACRWLTHGKVRPDRVTLWAGSVPADLDLEAFRARLPAAGFLLVLGQRDPFIRPLRGEEEIARLRGAGLPFELVRHPGGHRLEDALLERHLGPPPDP